MVDRQGEKQMDMQTVLADMAAKIESLDEKGHLESLPDGSFVVMLRGSETTIVDEPNVRCLNIQDPPEERIYLKFFFNKQNTWINNPDPIKNSLSNELSKLPEISKDGYIERLPDGRTVVLARGRHESAANFPGVECLNPEALPAERIYRKIFTQKKIYLPNEYDKAVNEVLGGKDSFVLSMNGFSRIGADKLPIWGLVDGEYEEGCADLLDKTIIDLRSRFEGVVLKLVDGGSDLGVDKALLRVRDKHNLQALSFSCPNWMLYVKDDEQAVFVAKDSDEYADRYIQSLHFLITTGGRDQALKHDVYAAVLYGKRVHFVDVCGMLSRNDGVPATSTSADGKVQIENAAAAMGRFITFAGQMIGSSPGSEEEWEHVVRETVKRAIEACAPKMSPSTRFRRR